MTRRYDLIVIGAGMGGVSAANRCASDSARLMRGKGIDDEGLSINLGRPDEA